jgi:hypothetical protein
VNRRRTLRDEAALEALRAERTGGTFCLVRISPAGLFGDLRAVERVLRTQLRRTDVVAPFDRRELGIVLPQVSQAEPVVERLRKELAGKLPRVDLRIGWGAVGPGHEPSWREGWRWAGHLVVADGAVQAAA